VCLIFNYYAVEAYARSFNFFHCLFHLTLVSVDVDSSGNPMAQPPMQVSLALEPSLIPNAIRVRALGLS
jgi:hypothetical protein